MEFYKYTTYFLLIKNVAEKYFFSGFILFFSIFLTKTAKK